jgi:putative acetyltransferase
MTMKMKIRAYAPELAKQITDLFHSSVHSIDSKYYSKEQKQAWSPSPPDYALWMQRLEEKQPFVAMFGSEVLGFIELEQDGHIDCLFTHPEFQNQGVASQLFNYLKMRAQAQGIQKLYTEASLVALPFFEKRGFEVIEENEVHRKGVKLLNYSMNLILE